MSNEPGRTTPPSDAYLRALNSNRPSAIPEAVDPPLQPPMIPLDELGEMVDRITDSDTERPGSSTIPGVTVPESEAPPGIETIPAKELRDWMGRMEAKVDAIAQEAAGAHTHAMRAADAWQQYELGLQRAERNIHKVAQDMRCPQPDCLFVLARNGETKP